MAGIMDYIAGGSVDEWKSLFTDLDGYVAQIYKAENAMGLLLEPAFNDPDPTAYDEWTAAWQGLQDKKATLMTMLDFVNWVRGVLNYPPVQYGMGRLGFLPALPVIFSGMTFAGAVAFLGTVAATLYTVNSYISKHYDYQDKLIESGVNPEEFSITSTVGKVGEKIGTGITFAIVALLAVYFLPQIMGKKNG